MSGDHRIYGAPRLPRHLLPRPRLQQRLQTLGPLTVIRDGIGSGKTTLLAEWCAGGPPVAGGVWVSVGHANASPTGFWRTVVDLLGDAGLASPTHILGQSVLLEGAVDVTSLLRRGFVQIRRAVTLVVDNGHLLDSRTRLSICELCAAVPNLTVLVATRSTRSFDEEIAATGVDAEIITDVAFTRSETTDFLAMTGRADDAEAIYAVSGGSPVLVRALAGRVGAAGHTTPDARSAQEQELNQVSELPADLVHRLVHTVRTSHSDPEFFQSLLRWTVPEELTTELASRLAPGVDATSWLDLAEDQGLGMWHERNEPVFAFTAVVRSALRAEQRRRHPEQTKELQRIVAEWSLANGRDFTAFTLAVQLGDLDLANSVIRRSGLTLLQVRGPQVRELLEPLPLTKLARYPLLAMMLGICLNAHQDRRLRAVELFALAALAGRRAKLLAATDRAVVRTVESAALRVAGIGDSGAGSARAAVRLLEEMSVADREGLGELRSALHAQNGLSLYYADDVDEALTHFERSYLAGRHGPDGLHGIALLAGGHALAGDRTQAQHWIDIAARSDWPEGWIDDYRGCFYRIAQALLALEAPDLPGAQEAIQRVWPIIDTVEHWALLAHVQALIDLAAGNAAAGAERLARVRRRRGKRAAPAPCAAALLDIADAHLHLALGDRAAAERAITGRHHRNRAASRTARARIHLAADEPERALEELARAAVAGFTSARQRAEHSAVELAALLHSGSPAQMRAAGSRTAAVLTEHGLRTPLMLLPRPHQETVLQVLAEYPGVADLLEPAPPAVIDPVHRVPVLTRRERVILTALVGTGSTAQIAQDLHVSTNTVKSQSRSLYRKLGARSRSEALAAAAAYGLLGQHADEDRGGA